MLRRAIVIAGPTGVGKTSLALRLAQRLGGDLISCDSVQVYRHLLIGANKETDLPDGIQQYLVDEVELDEPFTAADFYERCWRAVEAVAGRGRVPILVGGTGFYVDWVVRGRPTAPATEPTVLAAVEEELKNLGSWKERLQLLSSVDPEYAEGLGDNDEYRLKRAICVHRQTGKPLSSYPKSSPQEYDWRCFYLAADREPLNRIIDLRCEQMIERGLIQETAGLMGKGLLKADTQAGRSIGYQETTAFLGTERTVADFQEYLRHFQAVTRQYSRRQELWFRRMSEFKWIERPALSEGLPDTFVEEVAKWYAMDKEAFEAELGPIDTGVRHKITGDTKRNIKRMKSYSSHLQIFHDKPTIEEFLSRLKELL